MGTFTRRIPWQIVPSPIVRRTSWAVEDEKEHIDKLLGLLRQLRPEWSIELRPDDTEPVFVRDRETGRRIGVSLPMQGPNGRWAVSPVDWLELQVVLASSKAQSQTAP